VTIQALGGALEAALFHDGGKAFQGGRVKVLMVFQLAQKGEVVQRALLGALVALMFSGLSLIFLLGRLQFHTGGNVPRTLRPL
jgi:hypothetical protein